MLADCIRTPCKLAQPIQKNKAMTQKARSPKTTESSQVEAVLSHIRREISEGRYRPGKRVGEREISRKLSIGRGPVREAIQILIGRHVLERAPRHAARVRQLTLKDVLDVAEIWAVVGPLGSRLAAQRIFVRDNRERVLRTAERVWEEMRKGNPDRIAQEVARVTAVLAEVSENGYLTAVRDALTLEHYAQAVAEIILKANRQDDYLHRLRGLIEAIISGNPARAEAEHVSLMAWLGSILSAEYGLQNVKT